MDSIIAIHVWKNLVSDSLLGLSALNQNVAMFPFGNVIARKDFDRISTVKIISGGCSGIEPAFAGYVGKGMLTAAVQGEKYVAPNSKLILRTIRELSFKHFAGIFVIIRGSSENLLNFGVAMERALNDELSVKLLDVGDSCAKCLTSHGGRPLSGTVILIQKIAGAMSENEATLTEIHSYCTAILQNMCSDGIAIKNIPQTMDNCICKQRDTQNGLTPATEFKINKLSGLSQRCKTLLEKLFNADNCVQILPGSTVILFINIIGGFTKIEEWVLVKELVPLVQAFSINIARLYLGKYLATSTSYGFALTVMKVFDTKILQYLDAPCEAPAWQAVYQGKDQIQIENYLKCNLKRKDRLTPPIRGPRLDDKSANTLLLSLQFGCDALISCERQLNIIDSERGDGDTGTRFKRSCDVINKWLKNEKLVTTYPFTFFESLSKLLESSVGGATGCLYSILFEAAARCFSSFYEPIVLPEMWLDCLKASCDALQKYGKAQFGDGTMFDPLQTCAMTVSEMLANGNTVLESFGAGVSAAERAAEKTKQGFQYPDSGAHAVGIWMRAIFEGVKLRCTDT